MGKVRSKVEYDTEDSLLKGNIYRLRQEAEISNPADMLCRVGDALFRLYCWLEAKTAQDSDRIAEVFEINNRVRLWRDQRNRFTAKRTRETIAEIDDLLRQVQLGNSWCWQERMLLALKHMTSHN